jgi:hypothetical protein
VPGSRNLGGVGRHERRFWLDGFEQAPLSEGGQDQ